MHLPYDLVYTDHKRNGDYREKSLIAGFEFSTCNILTQLFFDLQQHLLYSIKPFLWLHMVRPIQVAITVGNLFTTVRKKQIIVSQSLILLPPPLQVLVS